MSFFTKDTVFTRVLNVIWDMMCLNLAFIICSLPVVTIGASASAMMFVAQKLINKEKVYVFKDFFRAFKRDFKKATGIYLIILAVGALLVFNRTNVDVLQGGFRIFVKVVIDVFLFLLAVITLYIFPLTARYEYKVKEAFRTAFVLAIATFPRALLMVAVTGIPIYLLVKKPVTFISFFVVIGFGAIGYLNAMIFNKAFEKVMLNKK